MKKVLKIFSPILVLTMVLLCVPCDMTFAGSKTWTTTSVKKELKSTKKQLKKYQKLYKKDQKRVKKVNKGKIYINTASSDYSDAFYMAGYFVIKDMDSGNLYAVGSGKSKLTVVKNWDGFYYVDGCVKKTGKTKTVNGSKLYFVKGVSYTKNKYASKLGKLRSKKNGLEKALKLTYTINDIPECYVGTNYDLTKYLSGDDKYNDAVWSVSDTSIATITDKGILTFSLSGTVNVTVKGSVSGKATTKTVVCKNSIYVDMEQVSGSSTMSEVTDGSGNAVKWIDSTCESKFKLTVTSDAKKTFSYISSNPELFAIDNNGVVTVKGQGIGTTGLGAWRTTDFSYYITATDGTDTTKIYLSAQSASITITAAYIPASLNSSFDFSYSLGDYYCKKLYAGDKIQLSVTPAASDSIKYTYSVLSGYATVDSNGLITMPTHDTDSGSVETYKVQVSMTGGESKTIYLHYYGIKD